jgi:hypothetical protein
MEQLLIDYLSFYKPLLEGSGEAGPFFLLAIGLWHVGLLHILLKVIEKTPGFYRKFIRKDEFALGWDYDVAIQRDRDDPYDKIYYKDGQLFRRSKDIVRSKSYARQANAAKKIMLKQGRRKYGKSKYSFKSKP